MAGKYLQTASQFLKVLKSSDRFGSVVGAGKCRPVSVEEGRVKVEFEVEESMTNPFGTLHGGCTASLVDVYTTLALLCTPSAQPGVSVDLHVSYLSSAKVGETLILDSIVTKQGRTLAFTKADLYRKKDNVLVATGVHTKAFPKLRK